MKITENFKNGLKIAKKRGCRRVYRIAGGYMATTYCIFHEIEELLNDPIGTDYGCAKPCPHDGMWTGFPNTRQARKDDIKFSDVFQLGKV
jgi:hypothetical protein